MKKFGRWEIPPTDKSHLFMQVWQLTLVSGMFGLSLRGTQYKRYAGKELKQFRFVETLETN